MCRCHALAWDAAVPCKPLAAPLPCSTTNFTVDVRSRWDGTRKWGAPAAPHTTLVAAAPRSQLLQRRRAAALCASVCMTQRCITWLCSPSCPGVPTPRPLLAVVQELERSMQAVCARRRLRCRLHPKNTAAAVEADPGVVQVSCRCKACSSPAAELCSAAAVQWPTHCVPSQTCGPCLAHFSTAAEASRGG